MYTTCRYPREFPVYRMVSVSFTCIAVTEWRLLSAGGRVCLLVSHTLNSPTNPPPLVFQNWTQPPAPHATSDPTAREGSRSFRNTSCVAGTDNEGVRGGEIEMERGRVSLTPHAATLYVSLQHTVSMTTSARPPSQQLSRPCSSSPMALPPSPPSPSLPLPPLLSSSSLSAGLEPPLQDASYLYSCTENYNVKIHT